jgi:hypothetical protein
MKIEYFAKRNLQKQEREKFDSYKGKRAVLNKYRGIVRVELLHSESEGVIKRIMLSCIKIITRLHYLSNNILRIAALFPLTIL